MGYELEVFRGDDPDAVERGAPFDPDLARDLLRRAEHAGDLGLEVVFPRETLTATVAVDPGEDDVVRVLYVSVDAHDESPVDKRREFRELLGHLSGVAAQLDAHLYDRERRRFIDRDEAEFEETVLEFGAPHP